MNNIGKILFIILMSISSLYAELKVYDIEITETIKNINNNNVTNFLLNQSSPGPVISANIGDTLRVKVNNKTSKDTIIHWHGLLVPNNQDGVANTTQSIIKSQTSHTYEFKVKQTGTYWYHAHGLEEAQGIYGGIIFKDHTNLETQEHLLLFSGELDKNPEEILDLLTGNTNVRSSNNNPSSSNQNMMNSSSNTDQQMVRNTSDRRNMNMMSHYSDVDYAKLLVNGMDSPITITESNTKDNKVKLRIVNAYVDGFLNFVYSGGDITIISSDGLPTKPLTVKNLRVAMGETYDILLDISNKESYELVAFLMGTKEYSKILVGNGKLKSLKSLDVNKYSKEQVYRYLETITPSFVNINKYNNIVYHNFTLQGNHGGYPWLIMENKKALDSLNVKVGDKIVVKITNRSMMPHPIHLHGSFFKVKYKDSNLNLVKHTVNIDSHESIEIEFIIDEEGKWLFHCHNLFHMASGMMITITASK